MSLPHNKESVHLRAFNGITKYFSKKEWEKMKYSEKINCAYEESNRAMTKLVERPQMTFGRLQRIIPEIMPKKPAEEGNDWKGVPEASGPQNDGKQLCPPGKPNTSEKINKRSGNREAQEKEERQGRAHPWSSQTTHNIHLLSLSSSMGSKRGKHAWTHRLHKRKQLVIYEEISDPEEDEE
nr:putative protein SSX6 [Chlorocebus sabaeus]